jgi:4-hydroxyacetophenone monooxygenase
VLQGPSDTRQLGQRDEAPSPRSFNDTETLDEAELRAALETANVPTLLMVLVQMTGDLSWLDPPYVLVRTRGMEDNDSGGLPLELQQHVRQAAATAIQAWQAGAPLVISDPDPELSVRMLGVSMGEEVPAEYGPFLASELSAAAGHEAAEVPLTVPAGFSAVVIGAGISGIAAGRQLAALGIPYTILERRADVGGVWLENQYPGAGVDTPSHLYSYSFAPSDWSRFFAGRDEILAYVKRVADDFSVRPHVQFGVSVDAVEWDDENQEYLIHTSASEIAQPPLRANVVMSCVGAFNPPVIPPIPGLDTFQGPCFHTANWPDDLVIDGKRVAVVGNGASAMQVVPAIAPLVSSLVLFQRSPQWAQPFEKFMKPVPRSERTLFDAVPLYRAWYRQRLSWIFHDKLYGALQRDPEWQSPSTINKINDRHRRYFTDYINLELGDRSDLADRVVPTYPPFGKRMLMDNGWFRTLAKPNVTLVDNAVAAVSSNAVVTADGERYPVDVIVLATGFDVVHFVSTFEITGREGMTLREEWEDDNCRAYLGLAVPGFPNFFTIYGPNTQTGHGGSLIHTVEAQLHYVGDVLRQMFDAGVGAVEVRRDIYDDFTETIDHMHQGMIWTHPGMSTYYRNSRGRVVAINPFRNVDYWDMTRRADMDDYTTFDRREVS